MQARLTYLRFPVTLIALFFALAAALLLGGVLGYELKPAQATSRPPTVIVEQPGPAGTTPICIWTDTHKGC